MHSHNHRRIARRIVEMPNTAQHFDDAVHDYQVAMMRRIEMVAGQATLLGIRPDGISERDVIGVIEQLEGMS